MLERNLLMLWQKKKRQKKKRHWSSNYTSKHQCVYTHCLHVENNFPMYKDFCVIKLHSFQLYLTQAKIFQKHLPKAGVLKPCLDAEVIDFDLCTLSRCSSTSLCNLIISAALKYSLWILILNTFLFLRAESKSTTLWRLVYHILNSTVLVDRVIFYSSSHTESWRAGGHFLASLSTRSCYSWW